MYKGAVRKRDLAIAAQYELSASARTVIVGVDLAGVYRQIPGTDEDAATAAEIFGVADVERRAALDIDRAEALYRQGCRIAGVDRHLAGTGDARDMNRASRGLQCPADNGNRAGHQAERPGHRPKGAAGDPDRTRRRGQEPKRRRRGGAAGAGIGVGCLKLCPIGHFEIVGGRGMKTARDVDRCVRPEEDAVGVDQVKIGAGDIGLDRAVDLRPGAAGDTADHIADRPGAAGGGERGFLGGRKAELAKAVEEVAADLLAEAGTDRVVRPDQRLGRRETAIDRDVLGRGHPRHHSRQRAGCDKGEGCFRSQRHGRCLPGNVFVKLCATELILSR